MEGSSGQPPRYVTSQLHYLLHVNNEEVMTRTATIPAATRFLWHQTMLLWSCRWIGQCEGPLLRDLCCSKNSSQPGMKTSAWQTESHLVEDSGEGPCSTKPWPPHGLVECSEPRHLKLHYEHMAILCQNARH